MERVFPRAAALLALLLVLAGVPRALGGPGLAKDYYVPSIPGMTPEQSDRYRQWAGHMVVDEASKSNLFFWLIATDHRLPKDKLVIWLNGGPGCSSMDGMFLEIGPFWIVDEKGQLVVKDNPYSWTQYANVLFVDQPVGVGYSYADPPAYMHTENEVSIAFLNFLTNFMETFPEYRRSELYIAGESFAGIYIPYIANGIIKRNEEANNLHPFNLRGIAIGNGWIDPQRQYDGYVAFAKDRGLLEGQYMASAERHQTQCAEMYKKNGQRIKYPVCENILDEIINFSRSGGKMCINMYDIRLRDTIPNGGCGLFDWPPRLDEMKRYLARDDVRAAVHADGNPRRGSWSECDESVAAALDGDRSPPSYVHLPRILKQMPVLLFSGDMDLICNHVGTEMMIDALEWEGATGWQNSSGTRDWLIEGQAAGTLRTERNLTYSLIYNSSHMVAVDKPKAMLELLNMFIGAPIGDAPNSCEKNPEGVIVNPEVPAPRIPKRLYIAGGVVLVFVSLFAIAAGYLFYRGRRKEAEEEARGQWHQLEDEADLDLGSDGDVQFDDLSPANGNKLFR